MIREVVLVKALEARLQSGDIRLPMTEQTALYVIKALAPAILSIMKEQIAEARREWDRRERQR
jgi:hypothetical protein